MVTSSKGHAVGSLGCWQGQHCNGCGCLGLAGMEMLPWNCRAHFCPRWQEECHEGPQDDGDADTPWGPRWDPGWEKGLLLLCSPQQGLSPGAARTSEELEVRKGLRENTTALLLHGQRDHHEAVGQLREVLDEVILPAERKRQLQSNDAGHGRAGGLSCPGSMGMGGEGGRGTPPTSRTPKR